MKVTILNQKYKVGCGKGINYFVRTGILSELNKVIDWSNSSFPKDKEGTENRKFLGDEPQLAPGNCFEYSGQIIAVDSEDRIVLIVSETGPFALERVVSEVLQPSLKVMKAVDILRVSPENINSKSVDVVNYRDMYNGELRLEPEVFNLWKRCLSSRGNEVTSGVIEYTVGGCDSFFIPVRIIISEVDRKVFYDSNSLDEGTAELLAECVVNYERNAR